VSVPNLSRVRWGVRAVLALGVAASVTANILHARPDAVAQTIAAWPPLALLLTIELISRVPVHHRGLAAARMGATVTIAGIAAWVSYWHMAGVAARYGEQGASPYLLPLSVDGLVIVASVCLVELAGRIRALTDTPSPRGLTVPTTSGGNQPLPPRDEGVATTVPDDTPDERPRERPPSAVKVARARLRNPALTQQAVADKTGLSLATVRRQWALTKPVTAPVTDQGTARVNGQVPAFIESEGS
jgi:hypothetical protein